MLNPNTHRYYCTVVCGLLSILLSACDNGSPSADYAQRLSNVLDVELNKVDDLNPRLAFPDQKSLDLSEPQHSLSIREFLGLRNCRLHTVIAQRNSQLGKVSTSSQRLKSDLDILATGPDCVSKVDDPALSAKLTEYLRSKRRQLPYRLWHALLTQSEYRQLWRATNHAPDYPQKLSSNTLIDDIVELANFTNRTLDGDFQISNAEFRNIELALGRLRFGDAGQLVTELTMLNHFLTHANSLVEQRLLRKLCVSQTPNTQARYLQNVVNKFFIQGVQTKAVSLQRRFEQIMPVIDRLERRLAPYATPSFNTWLGQRNQIMTDGLAATKRHAVKLQALYIQCGINTGTPSGQ